MEVFNVLFVKEQDNKFVVHCHDCAKKVHPRLEGFVVLNQYRLEDLVSIYDNFTLKNLVCIDVLPKVLLVIYPDCYTIQVKGDHCDCINYCAMSFPKANRCVLGA